MSYRCRRCGHLTDSHDRTGCNWETCVCDLGYTTSAAIRRNEECPECGHEKYNHGEGGCGQCGCRSRFICAACKHDWFHHHFGGCEAGLNCQCTGRPTD